MRHDSSPQIPAWGIPWALIEYELMNPMERRAHQHEILVHYEEVEPGFAAEMRARGVL